MKFVEKSALKQHAKGKMNIFIGVLESSAKLSSSMVIRSIFFMPVRFVNLLMSFLPYIFEL